MTTMETDAATIAAAPQAEHVGLSRCECGCGAVIMSLIAGGRLLGVAKMEAEFAAAISEAIAVEAHRAQTRVVS